MTVHEVSKLAGVSIRTLQYYDKIGLFHPTGYTDAGYNAQNLIKRIQDYITDNLYTCSNKILRGLGKCIQVAETLQRISMLMVVKVPQSL